MTQDITKGFEDYNAEDWWRHAERAHASIGWWALEGDNRAAHRAFEDYLRALDKYRDASRVRENGGG